MQQKKIVNNLLWLIIGQSCNVLSLFANIFTIKYVGPEIYGEISIAISFVGIFLSLGTSTLNTFLTKLIIESEKIRKQIIGSAVVINLILAILGMLILLPISKNIYDEKIYENIILYSIVLPLSSFNIIGILNNSELNSKLNSAGQILTTLINSSFKISIVILEINPKYFLVCFILDYLLMNLYWMLSYGIKNLLECIYCINSEVMIRIIKAVPYFSAIYLINYIGAKYDQLYLSNQISSYDFGLYTTAVRATDMWYFIPAIISNALTPVLAKYNLEKNDSINTLFLKIWNIIFLISFISIGFLCVYSGKYIGMIFGNNFTGSSEVFQIYIWSFLGFILMTINNIYFNLFEKFRIIFVLSILQASINFVLINILVNKYGSTGAALSFVISFISTSLIGRYCINKMRQS